MRWIPAYVAIGSNLSDPAAQVELAFSRLAALPDTQLIARSGLFLARPMGPQDQPDFINAAGGLLTQLPPTTLLAQLKGIEQAMGRIAPAVRWGARLIDLDLLVYSALVTGTAQAGELVLPHPGVHERNFVLYPLAQIAPDLWIPGRGHVAELARRVGSAGLQPL